VSRFRACDPDVVELKAAVSEELIRRAAGLHRLDGSARPAADVVTAAIAEGAAVRGGPQPLWGPQLNVVGARVALATREPTAITVKVGAGEDARALVCIRALEGTGRSCRRAVVPGLRALDLAVAAPRRAVSRVESRSICEPRRTGRRTRVVRKASLGG
jgi:hypothetical protein